MTTANLIIRRLPPKIQDFMPVVACCAGLLRTLGPRVLASGPTGSDPSEPDLRGRHGANVATDIQRWLQLLCTFTPATMRWMTHLNLGQSRIRPEFATTLRMSLFPTLLNNITHISCRTSPALTQAIAESMPLLRSIVFFAGVVYDDSLKPLAVTGAAHYLESIVIEDASSLTDAAFTEVFAKLRNLTLLKLGHLMSSCTGAGCAALSATRLSVLDLSWHAGESPTQRLDCITELSSTLRDLTLHVPPQYQPQLSIPRTLFGATRRNNDNHHLCLLQRLNLEHQKLVIDEEDPSQCELRASVEAVSGTLQDLRTVATTNNNNNSSDFPGQAAATDRGLALLGRCTQLRTLHFMPRFAPSHEQLVAAFQPLTNLETLYLIPLSSSAHSPVDYNDAICNQILPRLIKLKLLSIAVGSLCLAALLKNVSSTLEHLSMAKRLVPLPGHDSDMNSSSRERGDDDPSRDPGQYLHRLPNLREMRLLDVPHVDNDLFLQRLGDSKLEFFTMLGISYVAHSVSYSLDDGFSHLSKLPSLQEVRISADRKKVAGSCETVDDLKSAFNKPGNGHRHVLFSVGNLTCP